ncbi:hypothetical protein [Candidatus Pantoea persica]|uniref:hypothetical protein n=1 Tax=Candidatus Pantoea persica TaxID=2518128 RepID=UPI00215DAEFE|nr:hypothetical protein [Candidatus Pantoea persica]
MMHLSGGDITWFLHSLFLFFIAIVFVRQLPPYIVLPAFLAASYLLPAIDGTSMFSSFDNAHVNKSLYLFFNLGDLLVRKQADIPQLAQNGAILALSLISFIALSTINLTMAVPLFVWLAVKLRSRLVFYVGVNSIVFYLPHYLAIQFFSKIVKLNGPSPWSHDLKFVLAFVTGLAMPWTLCLMRLLFSLKQAARVKTV